MGTTRGRRLQNEVDLSGDISVEVDVGDSSVGAGCAPSGRGPAAGRDRSDRRVRRRQKRHAASALRRSGQCSRPTDQSVRTQLRRQSLARCGRALTRCIDGASARARGARRSFKLDLGDVASPISGGRLELARSSAGYTGSALSRKHPRPSSVTSESRKGRDDGCVRRRPRSGSVHSRGIWARLSLVVLLHHHDGRAGCSDEVIAPPMPIILAGDSFSWARIAARRGPPSRPAPLTRRGPPADHRGHTTAPRRRNAEPLIVVRYACRRDQ